MKTSFKATIVTLMAAYLVVPMFPPGQMNNALAHCNGTASTYNVVGYDSGRGNNVKGARGRILVNNFDDPHQYETIRSLFVWSDPTNGLSDFVEVGWDKEEAYGGRYVFKAYQNNGEYREAKFDFADLDPGTRRSFKVHDENGNQYWSFAYQHAGGSWEALGNNFVSFSTGYAITDSEAKCSSDILWAHFDRLEALACSGCSWNPFSDVRLFPQGDNSPTYNFCRISRDEHYVKQIC